MHELLPIIAILEDDPPLQELFVDLFTDEGYRVVCYPDSSSLFLALDQTAPVLILLDLHPRDCRGGCPILTVLRQSSAAARFPVMLMTTDSALLATHAESIRELRAVVQARPFDIAELLDNVIAAIGRSRTIDPVRAPRIHRIRVAPTGSTAVAW